MHYLVGVMSRDPRSIADILDPYGQESEEYFERVPYMTRNQFINEFRRYRDDQEDYTDGVNWILDRYNIPLILVSMGREGSRAYYKGSMVEAAPFLQKNTIETTGAGDTFGGCVLHYILEHGLEDLTEENLAEMLRFANAAAALITTRKGALRVMPSKEEVEKILQE